MALLNQPVPVYSKLEQFFETLSEGQAPEKFTRQFLKDIGFKSSNWHAAISLLKGLGFLSSDGIPTQQYMDLLDRTQWRKVLAKAVKNAYGDIFVIKREPSKSDIQMIAGKYKSTYNIADSTADRAARTFWALYKMCDHDVLKGKGSSNDAEPPKKREGALELQGSKEGEATETGKTGILQPLGLNYNIQIHLPATKDIEVYNAIFKSLREHIID